MPHHCGEQCGAAEGQNKSRMQALRYTIAILGFLMVTMLLWDAFEVIILPRRVTRRLRFARLFYRFTWRLRSTVGELIRLDRSRENYLSYFGPLSLLLLLTAWVTGLVIGFAMLQWGLQDRLNVGGSGAPFSTYLYLSGTTFFTLGLGDVLALGPKGRELVVLEAGLGFAFLGGVVTYLPTIYQAFSRREVGISLLDARAGSPPSAGELLRRNGRDMSGLDQLLRDWERWSAELLESHISYPFLVYFHSQHVNQSWLGALTAILDTSALVIAGIDGGPIRQAKLTFAMARHAVVELTQNFVLSPPGPASDRLPPSAFTVLRKMVAEADVNIRDSTATDQKLSELRQMYEPYVHALSNYLLLSLPQWFRTSETPDSWQISSWQTPIHSIATVNGAIQETNDKRFAEG
jgi:ion channel